MNICKLVTPRFLLSWMSVVSATRSNRLVSIYCLQVSPKHWLMFSSHCRLFSMLLIFWTPCFLLEYHLQYFSKCTYGRGGGWHTCTSTFRFKNAPLWCIHSWSRMWVGIELQDSICFSSGSFPQDTSHTGLRLLRDVSAYLYYSQCFGYPEHHSSSHQLWKRHH